MYLSKFFIFRNILIKFTWNIEWYPQTFLPMLLHEFVNSERRSQKKKEEKLELYNMKITIITSNHKKKHTKNGQDEYKLIKTPQLRKFTKYSFFF